MSAVPNLLVPVAHVTSRLVVATVFVVVHAAEIVDWWKAATR